MAGDRRLFPFVPYLLALALLPTYVVRWQAHGLPMTMLEVLLWLTFGAWALERVLRRDFSLPRTRYDPLVLLFVLAATIAVFVAADKRAALGLWKAYIIEPVLMLYVTVDMVRDERQARWTLGALGLSGMWLSAVYLGYIALHGFGAGGRATVIYDSPNVFPLYLGPLSALALAVALYGKQRLDRISALVFIVVAGAAMLVSLSLGMWLGVAVSWGFVLLWHRRRWWFVGAGALGLAAILSQSHFRARIVADLRSGPSGANTANERLAFWRVDWTIMQHHAILGVGLGGFRAQFIPIFNTMRCLPNVLCPWIYPLDAKLPPNYPHNLFLDAWTELGVLGLVAFVGILIVFLYTGYQQLRRADQHIPPSPQAGRRGWLAIGLVASLLYSLAHGQVDNPFWRNDLFVIFWVLVGLQLALNRWLGRPSPAPERASTLAPPHEGETRGDERKDEGGTSRPALGLQPNESATPSPAPRLRGRG